LKRLVTALGVAVFLVSAFPKAAHAEPRLMPLYAEDESSNADEAVSSGGGIRDRGPHHRPQMISFFAGLPFYYGFGLGVGFRYTIPIVHDGFIGTINNSVELEFGADMGLFFPVYNYALFGLGIPAEGRWTFHITDKFSAYGKAGLELGLAIGNYPYYAYGGPGLGFYSGAFGFIPVFGPGLLFKVSDKIHLRAEALTTGVRGGIGIQL
jgi:hypothetical protein